MATTTLTPTALPAQPGLAQLAAIAKLAVWRFKRMWRLLLVTWLGLLAMVVLICSGPLFTQVAVGAHVTSVIANAEDGPYLTVEAISLHPTQGQLQQIQQTSDQYLHAGPLAPYLHDPAQLVIQTPALDLLASGQTKPSAFLLDGYDSSQAAQHTTVLQGRLPQASGNNTLEIALSQDAASTLGLPLNSTFQARFPIALGSQVLTFKLVGIIAAGTAHDPFWAMGDPFSKTSVDLTSRYYFKVPGAPSFNALAANEALRPAIASLQSSANQDFSNAFVAFYRYPFDLSHFNGNDVPTIAAQTGDLNNHLSDKIQSVVSDLVYVNPFGTVLATLHNNTYGAIEASISSGYLLLITFGLVLFLVNILSNVLVERQAAIIATIRSRGATRRHVFGAFAIQGIILGLFALLLGPWLAVLLVRLMSQLLLTPESQQAASVITSDPLQSVLSVWMPGAVAMLVALLIMVLALNRASKLDIVSWRRESARAQRVPLWKRLNLDLFAVFILLVAYVAYLYFWPSLTTSATRIQPEVFNLLSTLGTLVTPLIAVAGILVFARVIPLLIRLLLKLVARRRSAPGVLALAQMVREPRRASRMVVLLALAVTSACFLSTLIGSKDQHNVDDANYYNQAADFSGNLSGVDSTKTLAQLKSEYSSIAGIQSATFGYHDVIQLDYANAVQHPSSSQGEVTIQAVDADTYANTALWQPSYSAQPLSDLTAQLKAHRADGISQNVVYALVDLTTWQRLHLHENASFTVPGDNSGGTPVNYIALAQINYVPGIYDTPTQTSSGMALIVDYQNYAAVKANTLHAATPILPNYVWLRTQDDAATLAHIRNLLPGLQDRRAILATMQTDPGHLGIIGALDIGVATALLLALLGMLILSWFSATSRLTNFAALRALGMSPRQLASVLLWEQGVIYVIGFILGLALGFTLTLFAAPAVATLTVQHGHAWDLPFNIPPTQVVIPFGTLALLLGALLIICLVALLLMARVISRPSLSQTLRLNED